MKHRMQLGKTALSFLLTVAMIFGMFPATSTPALAVDWQPQNLPGELHVGYTTITTTTDPDTAMNPDPGPYNYSVELNEIDYRGVAGYMTGAKGYEVVLTLRNFVFNADEENPGYSWNNDYNHAVIYFKSQDPNDGVHTFVDFRINIEGQYNTIGQYCSNSMNGHTFYGIYFDTSEFQNGGIYIDGPSILNVTSSSADENTHQGIGGGAESPTIYGGNLMVEGLNAWELKASSCAWNAYIRLGDGVICKAFDVDNGELEFNNNNNRSASKLVVIPPHRHSFTYAASDATITATCGGSDCELTSSPTLTIAAPTNTLLSSTNTAPTATLTGLVDFNTATGKSIAETDIAYYGATLSNGVYTKSSDTALSSAPTTVGDYVAEITLTGVKTADSDSGSVTASVGYTLNQAYELWVGGAQVTSAAPSGAGWAYDATTNTLTLNGFSSTAVYSVDGTGNAVIRHRGDRDLTISFTGENTLDASGDTQFGSSGMWSDSRQLILCEGEDGGTLICKGSSNYGSGINVVGSAQTTINSGTVTVSGPSGFAGRTNINGGEVTAIATGASAGAINGNYTNAIPGEAWDNAEGTGNSTPIDTHETAINGWGYKRMYFTVPYVALTGTAPTVTMAKANGNTEEGVPQIGDTLTAIPDPAKAKPVTYQWYRGTAAIEGATNSTYEVVADDVDSTLHVVITQAAGADGASSPEVTATSANTTAAKKKDGPAAPADAAAASFVINYPAETFTVNDTYEVSTSQSSDGVISDGSLTSAINGEGKVFIRAKETDDTQAGAWLEVPLASRPAAPTGLTPANATNGSTKDGEIAGTTTSMEYKLKDGEGGWTTASNDKTTGLAAGTYLVRTKATAEVPASKPAEVTVESKEIVLTDGQKPTAKTGLEYDVSKQELINKPAEALPEGAVEMQYALGKDATNPPEDGWSASIPTGTDAGTYSVWYKATSDQDHIDSKPACLTATIAKAKSTVTKAPAATNPTYNGKAQALVTAGTVEGGTMQYSLDGKTFSEAIPTGTEAKAYTVWYKVVGDKNHVDTEPQKVTSTITKKDEPTPTPAKPAKVAAPSTVAHVAAGSIDVSWKKAKGAKSYEVQWRVAGAKKWSTAKVKGTKKTITGLRAGKLYDVRVRGVDGSAKGAWSTPARQRWLRSVSKAKAATGKAEGSVKVSWKKDKSATGGYQVRVYAKKGGKAVATKTVSKAKASATITNLKSGKTYYVRVRPLRTRSGKTYVGALSGYRSVMAK